MRVFFGSRLSYRFRLDEIHRSPGTAREVLERLRVADSVRGQLTLALLNSRSLYEALAFAAEWVDALERRWGRGREVGAPGFQAWGPGQLRQIPEPDERRPGRARGPLRRGEPTGARSGQRQPRRRSPNARVVPIRSHDRS